MSSEPTVSFPSEVTRTSSFVVEVKLPTNSNDEAQRIASCVEGERGRISANDVQSRAMMMRVTAPPHSFSSSFVTACHVDDSTGMEHLTRASEVVTSPMQCSVDGHSQMDSTSQRHGECPGCAAQRVVYHTCNLQPHDQLAFCEYPLSSGSLAPEYSLTSLQEGGEGTLTYSAQAPVSATHIQHSHGAVPFGSHQVGTIRSPQCQHDCTSAPEKHSEVDPYYTAYGEQLGKTGSQRLLSSSDVPRPCPIHGSETFVTSFNPTFDIPLYSDIPRHPYLPHYYVQPPPHHHPLVRRPIPTHLPSGAPYTQFHAAGHRHCCATLFHDGMTEVRRQFPSHYEPPPTSVIPDDHFQANISTGTLVSQSHACSLHEEHEDLQFLTTHHSMASPEGNGLHGLNKAEPSSGSFAGAGSPDDIRPDESRTTYDTSFGLSYQVREPEMFVVSTDVTNDEEEESSVLGAIASEDVPVIRKRKSESFVCDLDGSSVDGNLLNLSLASHLKSYSADVGRSHTPPERDTNSKREVEETVATDITKAKDEPRGMAFTIDFGNDLNSPEITEHWKQFTPFRIHAGIQERASKTKSRLKEKSESLEGEQVKKGTNSSSKSGEGHASGTKIRSRSPGSRSVGGYISDGRGSGISSDNEDASICSEMIGCIQGRRRFNRLSDPRSFLTSGPLPSKSQPSLVKAKPDRVNQNIRSAPSRGAALSKSARSTPSGGQVVSKTGTKKVADPKPGSERAASTKSEPPKRLVKSAKTASESTPVRRLPKRPCDDGEAGDKKDDEIIDVTSYLINRMLFPSDKSSNGFKTKSRPLAGRDLHTGSPSSAPLHRASGPKRRPTDENIPDNVSETGTYTIEDDPQMTEVQKARDDIGVVFGVKETKPDRLVRPVIKSSTVDDANAGPGPSSHRDVAIDRAGGEEDVFEYEPDHGLQEEYKLEISEAVSSAISATKAIQKALLQKTSRSQTSSEGGGKATEVVSESSESYPSNIKSVNQISSSEPSADLGRQCATDVYDKGDFGTFSISFDAPSPKLRDSICLSQEDASGSTREMTATPDNESSPAAEADSSEDQRIDNRLKYANDVQLLMQSVDATVQELHEHMCERSKHLKSSGSASSHPVQRPSREATFVKEIPPKDASSSSRTASQPRNMTFKPPSSTSGRRNRDCDASDGGSESETASLSSMDYSTASSRFTRASILRSSSGKGPLPAPRVNRTFALRCSKASGSESDATAGLVPRSRSAGNDSRLALRDAGSRSTSRSRSRPRIISPASDISRGRHSEATAGQRYPARRKDLEQQHSEDSSASICSSISSRGSSTFIRKDGGRYSMRTEKSSVGPMPISTNRTKDKKLSKPKSAGSQSSRDRPGSGGSTASQRQMTTAQAKELNAWKRRKQYDPRKAVAEAKAKGGAHGISKHSNGSQSEPEDGAAIDDDGLSAFDYRSRRTTEESERATEIAQLSNAVAYNLNVLAESTRKDTANPDELRLQKLPVFSCDSNTRSAFSALNISGSHKAHSIPFVASDHNTSIEETEKSTYDNVLVNSIQQVSRKVKVLTDQLITKVRDEKRRGGSVEGPMISPLSSGTVPTWEHASPELASILENLKRTEQHLQVVHKALFSGNVRGRGGPEAQRHQTVERQRVFAEKGGFKPIEKPASATSVRKRSTSRKQSSLSTNPLSGDEYY